VGILADPVGGIAGVVDEDFLGGDGDIHRFGEGFDVEVAVGVEILHQVQRGQVACGVIQEHVFAARIAGVDARGGLAGVPAIDGGVVLHAGIAAGPGESAILWRRSRAPSFSLGWPSVTFLVHQSRFSWAACMIRQ